MREASQLPLDYRNEGDHDQGTVIAIDGSRARRARAMQLDQREPNDDLLFFSNFMVNTSLPYRCLDAVSTLSRCRPCQGAEGASEKDEATTHADEPHRREPPMVWTRTSGTVTMQLRPLVYTKKLLERDKRGSVRFVERSFPLFPYGTFPRLLLAWVTTEALRRDRREITLGGSMASLLKAMGKHCAGGENGSIRQFKRQFVRLFGASFYLQDIRYSSEIGRDQAQLIHMPLAEGVSMPVAQLGAGESEEGIEERVLNSTSKDFFDSSLVLGSLFFENIKRSVPVKMSAVMALSRSPLAIDLYAWATYRRSHINKRTTVRWVQLLNQFGSDSSLSKFKENMLRAIKMVEGVYPELRFENATKDTIDLMPGPTSVPMIEGWRAPSQKRSREAA